MRATTLALASATSLIALAGTMEPVAFAAEPDVEGADVQTRGPVHEAFAGIVTYNPKPGVVVAKPPPEPVEEMPPEEKPEGENVTWIPGYWGWDDERKDYLWISGTWRALPPGRAWIAGYWAKASQGHQWTSGYWADSAQKESTYLPAPPATIEAGPNVAAPSPDYVWMPGCWMWTYNHYAWRPGYWAIGRPDWDWVPPHYSWTPRGYILVGGYWDYPVARRGVLFAPVFFAPHVYVRPHYIYSPSIVIDLGVFSDHLFCRPSYHHYYFGDYYAPAYVQSGFYASFSFHIGRHGYDPIYSHHRWEHRHERDWHNHLVASHRHRRDHEDARPPRTWVQQRNVTVNKNVTINNTRIENRVVVANTFDQYRRRTDNPVRFQSVDRTERQTLVQRNREVQASRQQRQALETARPSESVTVRPNETRAVRAEVPKSSIVAKPVRDLAPNNAPPSPPRAPRLDPTVQPTREPVRDNRGQNRIRVENQSPSNPQKGKSAPADTQPERPILTPPQREQRTPTPPSQQRTVPSTPQQPQERRTTPSAPQTAPLTPQQGRRDATPSERKQHKPVAPSQSQPAQPAPTPTPERAVPSSPQQDRRGPEKEREVPPQASGRAAPAPSAPPREPQSRVAGPAGPRQASPQRPGKAKHLDRKGAEQLQSHGKKDQ